MDGSNDAGSDDGETTRRYPFAVSADPLWLALAPRARPNEARTDATAQTAADRTPRADPID